MAGTINDELKDQNKMLNKLDDDLGGLMYMYI